MARSIWSGSISFGLVNVPVKLYTAVARKTVHFHQLHDADGSRIQQKRFCAADGEEVPYENIVKGYEVSPGRYVVVDPAELESLDPKKSRLIEIEQFVDAAQIDPILYDQPYYLAPAAGAAKAYALMLAAMRDAGRVAIARVVLRQKEHLVALRATDDVLIMATLVFADEVVSPSTLEELGEAAEVQVADRELKVARQLIEMLSGPFVAADYRDDYREAVLALIERKIAGEQIAVAPQTPPPAAAPDLMAALQASVEAVGKYNARWDGEEAAAAGAAKPKRAPAAKPKPAPAAKPGRATAAKAGRASAAKPARQPTKKS
jgi:DNA end-binding protein Ku